MAITTRDNENVTDFNSSIIIVDTNNNEKKSVSYIEAVKESDIFVTSHLDGFASEDIKKYGVTPVIYRGSIKNAIDDLKDCGIKRSLPIGESEGCNGGSCGV